MMKIVTFIISVIFTDIIYQIIKNDVSISLRKLFNKNCKVIVKFKGITGIHNSPDINQIVTIKNLGQDVLYVKGASIKVCQKYNPLLGSYKIGKMKTYKNIKILCLKIYQQLLLYYTFLNEVTFLKI